MTCEKIRELLFDYVSGELDDATAETVKAHLEVCEDCKKEYELLLGMSEAINDATFEAPAELHGRIMSAVENEKKRIRRARLVRNLTAIGTCAAAFVIVVNAWFGNMEKENSDRAPGSPNENKQEESVLKADDVFKPMGTTIAGETAELPVELSASTVRLFVGEWRAELSNGRSVTMYISDDNSVTVCLRGQNGYEIYYDGMLEFTKDGITLSQSDGNQNCRAVIDAVISDDRLYFYIVSGNTPWRT